MGSPVVSLASTTQKCYTTARGIDGTKGYIMPSASRIITSLAALVAAFALFTVPAYAQGFTVSFGTFEYSLAPGESVSGSIHVTNQVDQTLAVKVYLGDLVRNPNGSNEYDFDEEMGHEQRSLASWLRVSPAQFD